MGAGASASSGGMVVPEKLDIDAVKNLAGDKFDQATFDAAKVR
jgi:hypothetical protein